jgi:ABC-2 type transport system permease protein
MKHALAIAFNDLLMRLSERDTLLFSLILPILFTTVTGIGMDAAFSDEGDNRYPVAVADADGGALAAEVLDVLAESAVLRVAPVSEGEAREMLDEDEVYAVVLLPAGFSEGLMEGQTVEAIFLFSDLGVADRVREEIQAAMDRVGAAVAAAQTAVSEAETVAGFANAAERRAYFETTLASAKARLDPPPVGVETEVATALEEEDQWANFTGASQSSPGMVVMFGMTTMLGVGIVLVQERRMGTLQRLLITPASKASILAGKFAGTFLLGLLQTAILILFGLVAFDVPWGRDPLALVVIVFAFALAIVSLGILFATLVRTEEQAGNIMVGAAMAMAALGGAWWPITITPEWMQTLGHAFPSAWAMDAFQAIILQGATLGEVLPQAGILLGYAVVFFALGVWRLKFE